VSVLDARDPLRVEVFGLKSRVRDLIQKAQFSHDATETEEQANTASKEDQPPSFWYVPLTFHHAARSCLPCDLFLTWQLARTGASAVPTKRKQQGEDWKQSRLAPDIPLHMTTRRAAKTSSNHTSSAAPSSAASGSRRSSLNDVAQQSDFDDEPAKHSRMSTDSGSPNGSFGNNTPLNGTQTPELDQSVSEAVLQVSNAAGKKRRASEDSTQSSRTRPNGVLTRTQSDVSEQQPRRKKRKTASAPADSADQPPDLTDASTAPNSPEPVPDVAISQSLQNVLPANGDGPAKIPKRLPGRRRQPHPDMNVEVDLRRQLSLKTSYRSVAKVLKGYLDELAQRTVKNLDDDSEFHKNCPEYKLLVDGLDRKRDAQLDYLAAWRSERMNQLERVQIAEKEIQERQYIVSQVEHMKRQNDTHTSKNRFEDLRDDFLQRCYFRMKQIEREWKAAQDDATDDEVIPSKLSHPTHLTLHRTTCYPRLTLRIQFKVLTADSGLSLRHVAEHMSRLIGSLRAMSNERRSTNFAKALSTRMTMQMTPSKTSPAASRNLLDLTVQKQSHTTTSTVLPMLHTTSRGRHRPRRRFNYRRLKSSPTTKPPCSCSLPIFQQRRRTKIPTPLLKYRRTHTSLCMPDLLLLISALPGSHHRYRCQTRLWLFRRKWRLKYQWVRRIQVSMACLSRRRPRCLKDYLRSRLLHARLIASWICLITIQMYQSRKHDLLCSLRKSLRRLLDRMLVSSTRHPEVTPRALRTS
jgi:hypothetical protein